MLTNSTRFMLTGVLSISLLFTTIPDLFAFDCFSPSYSIQQGRGVFEEIIPRDLSEGEYQNLQTLFRGLEGDWSGDAWVLSCIETPDEVREEMDHYSIKSEAAMHSTGQFVLESVLYSKEKRTSGNEILKLYLRKDKLASKSKIAIADIKLISVSSDELVYVEKRQIRSASGALSVREPVTTLKKTGQASFALHRINYINGRLISESIWYLKSN